MNETITISLSNLINAKDAIMAKVDALIKDVLKNSGENLTIEKLLTFR